MDEINYFGIYSLFAVLVLQTAKIDGKINLIKFLLEGKWIKVA